jgi:hypothetical protein
LGDESEELRLENAATLIRLRVQEQREAKLAQSERRRQGVPEVHGHKIVEMGGRVAPELDGEEIVEMDGRGVSA